jgi:tetratricopeptide (TPR) repeat protein
MRTITAILFLCASLSYGQISLEYSPPADTSNYAYLRKQLEENQTLLDADSSDVRALANRATLSFELQDFQTSIADYTTLEKLLPAGSNPYTYRGFCYAKLGEYDLAIADFNRAIALDSAKAEHYLNRAFAYSQAGLYERAVEDLSKAISINSNYKEAYVNRGENYKKLKQYVNAIQDYSLAIAYQTNYAEAYLGRGDVYFEQELFNRALVDYNAVRIMYPQSVTPGLYLKMGISKMNTEDDEGALQDFSRVILLAPQFTSGYYYRALLESNNGDYEAALTDITKAIELAPDNIDCYALRMEIYHSLGLKREEKNDKRMIKALVKEKVE